MELDTTDRSDGITQVALVGKLDVGGLHDIDVRFHEVTAAAKRPAIIDLGRLEFVASLGMGLLISCAQSLNRKGCKMVLYGARGDVDAALRTAGIDRAIPMVATEDEAVAAATGA